MTPLEIVGFAALGTAAGQLVTWLFRRPKRDLELEQRMVRGAFEAGILAAADMATLEGHEELAGSMRKAVANVRSSRDS